ncbi:MAG: FHA domain-containing protein [Deltaproteobacteria bacterium]|nr:FHA domain-containing protein [Deltaproteobacteria bacterium]
MDQNKKTMRHFYCRDVLWDTFEQMANDFDCSIDYLINEAMRYYARSKNYAPQQAAAPPQRPAPGPSARRPPPPPGAQPPPAAVPSPAGRQHSARRTVQQEPQREAPAPRRPPPGARPQMEPPQQAPTLYLIFNSQRIPIDKDQFIIGRGSKTSDLAIKDGNISRKHSAIIRRNGTYYVKDLGSTNGIDYKGMRIDNKRIDEGDVFHLCDYELRFTYRP